MSESNIWIQNDFIIVHFIPKKKSRKPLESNLDACLPFFIVDSFGVFRNDGGLPSHTSECDADGGSLKIAVTVNG